MLAFPMISTVHVMGTAFLAGTSSAIALRIRPCLPSAAGLLALFYPILWLYVNAASGTLLLTGYPATRRSPIHCSMKLTLIALAIYLAVKIRNDVLHNPKAGKPGEIAVPSKRG